MRQEFETFDFDLFFRVFDLDSPVSQFIESFSMQGFYKKMDDVFAPIEDIESSSIALRELSDLCKTFEEELEELAGALVTMAKAQLQVANFQSIVAQIRDAVRLRLRILKEKRRAARRATWGYTPAPSPSPTPRTPKNASGGSTSQTVFGKPPSHQHSAASVKNVSKLRSEDFLAAGPRDNRNSGLPFTPWEQNIQTNVSTAPVSHRIYPTSSPSPKRKHSSTSGSFARMQDINNRFS